MILQHYFEGKTFPQIAAQQSRPAGTVQKQCRRAVEKLSRLLKKKGVAVSATVVASGLGAQLGKAASAPLVAQVASHALANGSAYSPVSLTVYMASQSKLVATLAVVALLLPLGLQQAAIQRSFAENHRLREVVVARKGLAPMRSSLGERRQIVHTVTEKKVTIETVRRAYVAGQRGGRLKRFEFEEVVDSFSAEELSQLIPQAFGLSESPDTKRDLIREMVARLTRLDPEQAVRVTWDLNPETPVHGNLGLESAVYLWAEKEPEQLVEWLLQGEKKVAEIAENDQDIWSQFSNYVSAALSSLIESRSPHVREVLTMASEMQTKYLLRGALGRPTRGGYYTASQAIDNSPSREVERFTAFLPWIREFVPKVDGHSGVSQHELLKRAIFESDVSDGEEERRFFELLIGKEELLPRERSWMVELRADKVLQGHFDGRDSRGWEVIEGEARDWLESYAEEDAEVWFRKVRDDVLKKERFQVEHRLGSLERQTQVRDGDLERELKRRDYSLFPEFRERALEQAKRIKDGVMRQEVVEHVKE